MKLLIKKTFIIILVSIIFILIVYCYITRGKEQKNHEQKEVSIYEKITESCPRKDTIGTRQCTYDFLNEKEKEATIIYDSLVNDIKEKISRVEDDFNKKALERFLDNLTEYSTQRNIYSKTLCNLDSGIFDQGSAYSEIVTYCEIEELENYISNLNKYREVFIE